MFPFSDRSIALVSEADFVSIEIPNRRIDLEISEEDLQNRFQQWKPPNPKVTKGILATNSSIVKPTSTGATFLF
jgi:dihydroxy-acid dehydratase